MSFARTVCHRRFQHSGPKSNLVTPGQSQKVELDTCIGPACMLFVPMIDPNTQKMVEGKCADVITALSLNQLVMLKTQELDQEEKAKEKEQALKTILHPEVRD